MSKLCEYCHKPLRAIGKQRKNGRAFASNDGNDWPARRYHKKCLDIVCELKHREMEKKYEAEKKAAAETSD